MRGQAELIVFILLFLIGLTLFSTATIWGRDIFEENVDFSRIEAAEKFMKDLDSEISNVIKFGGMREVSYGLEGTIELLNTSVIEVRTPVSMSLQQSWVNISEGESFIMEKQSGSDLVLQLVYPVGDYKVFFYTEGSSLAHPNYVMVEKNSTISGSPLVIKIKITFV